MGQNGRFSVLFLLCESNTFVPIPFTNVRMKYILVFIQAVFVLTCFAQSNPIEVAENTLKIPGLGEEVFYFGFAEGDQLIFNFQELNNKELKEVEIIEYPNSSKFMDYKTKRIENKTLTINKTCIYKFRFANSALLGRVCRFKIQRIPASDQFRNFNTSVYWRTAYDTLYTSENEKYLVRSDTSVSNFIEQVAKVHSAANLNGNRTTFNFQLPANTVAWSYYIGVDQAGQQAYENATRELTRNAAPIISKIPGYGPLAALALGGACYLSQLQAGEDIDFYIVEGENVNLFRSGQAFIYIKKGKVINDFAKMNTRYRGNYHVCLLNDNAITGVVVTVKITAIVVTQEWSIRPVKKIQVSSRQEAYLKN